MEVWINNDYVKVERIPIKGDGACLFNMLSVAMFGHEMQSLYVRGIIVRHILEHYDEFRHFIMRGHYSHSASENDDLSGRNNEPLSAEEYGAHMMSPFSYGTFVELAVAARIFERKVYI
uniref:OTU domain-containing protein n=1 Tax=Cacopsylla melanoneura TaxID=428564 RepID=A0A8D8Q905_9HEMI